MGNMGTKKVIEHIDWAIETIRERVMFGLDALSAALSRERRAKGALLEAKKHIIELEKEIANLKARNHTCDQ